MSEKEAKHKDRCVACDVAFDSVEQARYYNYCYHQEVVEFTLNNVVDCQMSLSANQQYNCGICKNMYKGYHNLLKHFKKMHPQYELRNYKRKPDDEFTFEEGSCQAVGNKKIKADLLVETVNLVPTKVQLTNNNIRYDFYDLASNSTMTTLNELGLLNKEITCSITGPTAKKISTTPSMSTVKISQLQFPSFPNFFSKMGDYVHLPVKLENQLNDDSCDISKVAQLFVGSLLIIENVSLLVLTVETYARDIFHDVHAQNLAISFPEELDSHERYYKSIKIALSTQGQGKQLMKKLIIGTKQFNLLVTSLLVLAPRKVESVTCGPTCHTAIHNLDLNYTQILLRKNVVDDFESGDLVSSRGIHNCRQLMSAFDYESTYLCYRASLLQNPNLQPLTVFTIGGVPGNDYGMSIQNKARIISHFFKTCASWILKSHCIDSNDIQNLKSSAKANADITAIVIAMKKMYVDANNVIHILEFLQNQKGLSTMAQSLSTNISVHHGHFQ